jgi:hypothetical protein
MCAQCSSSKGKAGFSTAQIKKKAARRCKACVEAQEGPPRPADDASATTTTTMREGAGDDDDDERPELRAALEALQREITDAATSSARRAAALAEAADVEETLHDLEQHTHLQDELDVLEALRGPERKEAKARISAIGKALDLLEAKHAAKQFTAQPVEPPAGVACLDMERAAALRKTAPVLVCADEAYVRYQCVLSHKLALSKGAKGRPMLIDSSANGRARRRALGQAGRITDLDRSDASAKVALADGSAVWFPVAALSEAAQAAAGGSAPPSS